MGIKYKGVIDSFDKAEEEVPKGAVKYLEIKETPLVFNLTGIVAGCMLLLSLASIIEERDIQRKSEKIITDMILYICSAVLIIGADFSELLQGKFIGSLLVLPRMMGGAVIIAAGYIVIKEKAKLDSLEQTAVQPEQIEQLSE